MSATVSNAGDGESAATTLRYHQSTDSAITNTDTVVGTDLVAALGATGSSSESVDLTAPSSPGTYYYGACVDAVADESDTTNNCSSSVQVTLPSNQSPVTVGTIGALELMVRDTVDVEVSGNFQDPEGGPLAYIAAAADQRVATATAAGTVVEVVGAQRGQTTVTVTATDTGELSAEQTFGVTVVPQGNRPPMAVGTIADLSLNVRAEDQTYPAPSNRYIIDDFRRYFRDPDGDHLDYSANSSNSDVVTARVSIVPSHPLYQVYGRAVGTGEATVTITATDTEGLTGQHAFGVTVGPPIPNGAPTVSRIPRRTVYVGQDEDRIRLRQYFDDNDLYGFDFDLRYTVSTADTSIARSRLHDKRDPISRHGFAWLLTKGVSKGRTATTVRGTDRLGLSVETTFNVVSTTRPPIVERSFSDRSVVVGKEVTVFDIHDGYFSDPDGTKLEYNASSSDTSVVRTSVRTYGPYPEGNRTHLTLTARWGRVGTAEITVTATDPTEESVSQAFTATVTAE